MKNLDCFTAGQVTAECDSSHKLAEKPMGIPLSPLTLHPTSRFFQFGQVKGELRQVTQACGEAGGTSADPTSQATSDALRQLWQCQSSAPDESRARALRATLAGFHDLKERLEELREEKKLLLQPGRAVGADADRCRRLEELQNTNKKLRPGEAVDADLDRRESLQCLSRHITCMQSLLAERWDRDNLDDVHEEAQEAFGALQKAAFAQLSGKKREEVPLTKIHEGTELCAEIFRRLLPRMEAAVMSSEDRLETLQLQRLRLEGKLKAMAMQRSQCRDIDWNLKYFELSASKIERRLPSTRDRLADAKQKKKNLEVTVRPTCSVG